MRSRIVLLFVLALVCAAGAAWLVLKKVQQMEQPAPEVAAARPATLPVLVATRDLPSGAIIGPADTRVVQWPADSLPLGGMAPDSIAFGETVVRLPIAQNAPIIDTQIVQATDGGPMAYVVSPGRVALAIAVVTSWGSTAVAGHVTPGTYVDILYVHSLSATTDQASSEPLTQVAETLLVGVKVLAVDLQGDDVNPESRVTMSVTVEVSPKEAEMLVLAGANMAGALTLALNSAIEPSAADLLKVADVRRGVIPSYTTQSELSAVFAPPPPASEDEDEGEFRQAGHTVFVFRGAVVQEISMPAAGLRAPMGQPATGQDAEVLDASAPAGSPVEAQGDAEAGETGSETGDGSGTGKPQSLLPQKVDLRGGS
jgi:pilus assembly protein CpaB